MKLERLDKWLLWTVCVTIAIVIVLNFITSYQHIYSLGLKYGEYGTDARLLPVAIDGTLLALAVANVLAARFHRESWLLRVGLGIGVASTIAANGAYGAHWGLTGNLLGVWPPAALFITVESGLYMFRIVADATVKAAEVAAAVEAAKVPDVIPAPRRGRPPGVKNTDKTPETAVGPLKPATIQPALPPVITGHMAPNGPVTGLTNTGQFPVVK